MKKRDPATEVVHAGAGDDATGAVTQDAPISSTTGFVRVRAQAGAITMDTAASTTTTTGNIYYDADTTLTSLLIESAGAGDGTARRVGEGRVTNLDGAVVLHGALIDNVYPDFDRAAVHHLQ